MTRRKVQLVAAACCHRISDLLLDNRSRQALHVLERHADGWVRRPRLRAAHAAAEAVWSAAVSGEDERFGDAETDAAEAVANATATDDVLDVGTFAAQTAASARSYAGQESAEAHAQATLLRCIVGNPFRPVGLDPGWRTPAVVALAEGVYADRAWDRLPILADALEDAGCADADVVGHLRGPGPHARGCWVVDLLLGKS